MPISESEEACEGVQEVGEVYSTDDMRDSITFMEERRLAVCTPVLDGGGLHSSLGT